jgi:hypothetical protein
LVDKALTEAHQPMMVEISTRNLHTVHKAFGKHLVSFGNDAEELATKLFYRSKHSAARRSYFKDMQYHLELDDVFLLRNEPSRLLVVTSVVN